MSGEEGNRGWEVRNLGLTDIDEFGQSTSAAGLDLNVLRNATGRFKNGVFSGGYGSGGRQHDQIAPVISAYNAWKKERDSALATHAEYVKLIQERPGRKGTILVPTEEKKNATLLTPDDVGQITVLG